MAKVGEVFVKLFMDKDEFTQGMEEAEKEAEQLEKKMTGTGRTIRGVINDISERFSRAGEGMIDAGENLSQAIGLPFLLLGTLAVMAAKETTKGHAAVKKLADGFNQVKKALAPVGQAILDMAVKYMPPFIKAVQSVSKWFQELTPRGKEFVLLLGGLAVAAGPTLMFLGALTMILGGLGNALAFLLGPIGWAVAAVAGLGVAFYKASGGLKPFLNNLKWLGSYLAGAAMDGDYLNDAITHLDNRFRSAALAVGKFVAAIHDNLSNVANVIAQEFEKVSPKFQAFWNTFVRGIREGNPELIGYAIAATINTAVQMLPALLGKINWNAATQGIVKGLNFALKALATVSGSINWQAVAQVIAQGLGRIAQFAGVIAPALVNGLIQIINKINWAQLGTAFGNLVTTLAPIIANLLSKLIHAIPLNVVIPSMIQFGIDFAFAFMDAVFDPALWVNIVSKHWFDLLLLIFAPARMIRPLLAILRKIPIVGPLTAWLLEQVNKLGQPLSDKVGSKIGEAFSTVKEWAVKKIGPLKERIKAKFDEFVSHWKGVLLNKLGEMWDRAKEKIKSGITNALNGHLSKFTKAATEWKDKLLAPFKKLDFKSLVQKAINAIGNIRVPHIKTPHFKKVGEIKIGPVSLPKIGVSWYKTGGLFSGPSIIGVGEAGPEAVVPLSGRRMKPFAEAIASQMGGANGLNITVNNYSDNEKAGRSIANAITREMWIYGLY